MAAMQKRDERGPTTGESVGRTEPSPDPTQSADQLLRLTLSDDTINARLREDLQDLLIAGSLGIDPAVCPLHRHVPVEIYVPGKPEEIEIFFLDLTMGLLEFGRKIGWPVHTSGPVQMSSLKVGFVLRTIQKITLRELQDDSEIISEVIADAVKAERKTVAMREKEAKINSLTAEASLARAKKIGIYATLIGLVLNPFFRVPPGSYVQIGTTRIVKSDTAVTIEHVPPSTVFAVAHFQTTTSGDAEKHDTK